MPTVREPSSLLVIGPSWVGDMVMSQTLYKLLRQHNPDVQIDVLAPPWSEPILSRMPEVRRAIPLSLGHGDLGLRTRYQLGCELRQVGYQQAILLPNSLKSALIPFFAKIPRRTGWRGEMRYGLLNDMRRLDDTAPSLMGEYFAALGFAAGSALPTVLPTPSLVIDSQLRALTLDKFIPEQQRSMLALCPGAEFGSAKRWPVAYYRELAQCYLDQGWQVVLFGSANDAKVTAAINSTRQCIDLAGKTSLAEAIDLLSGATLVLSNDSGLMHIAAALTVPLVVLYGPTSPGFTPPLSERALTLVSDVECAPCFQRECPLGHHRCMREMSVEQVRAQLDTALTHSREH